jgi:hypothetical protein
VTRFAAAIVYPEPISSTGLLSFPLFKSGFHGQKVFMFVILRMSLDRCPGSGEPTTARWPNNIFGQYLRQCVRELTISR